MRDRDSINELFSIVKNEISNIGLPMADSAMDYIKENLGKDYDIYLRRRLSVCRTLISLYLPVPKKRLDILLTTSLLNYMPDDPVPPAQDDMLKKYMDMEPAIEKLLSFLTQVTYKDRSYYENLINNPEALIIRLAERSVLVEKLYEWHPIDALRFVRETRESFFPMCLYAKEHYPEYLGAASVLHEKMRNLTAVNDALLSQFLEIEYAIGDETLSIREENAAIRAMIKELEEQ
ncbi:MAG: hypothetical protein MJ097_08065 [Dorea sp.]|nr:hypothetical protein [Dorea sp.]